MDINICQPSLNCWYRMSLYAVGLQFPFIGAKAAQTSQHGSVSVHNASTMKTLFAKVGVENHRWLHRGLTSDPHWTTLGRTWMWFPRPSCTSSVLVLTNTLVAKWAQILTAVHQNLEERLLRRVEDIVTEKRRLNLESNVQKAHMSVLRCSQVFCHTQYELSL